MDENKSLDKRKKFVVVTTSLRNKLEDVKSKEDLLKLGFIRKDKLCIYQGYSNFQEHLWVWIKEENEKAYTILTSEECEEDFYVLMADMYIKEIVY